MKKAKKIASLLLALVMVFSMTITAFAADETEATKPTYTLTLQDAEEGHTYQVYQIFTGDVSGTGDQVTLSNIEWGSGVSKAGQSAFGDAAEKADELQDSTLKSFINTLVTDYLGDLCGTMSYAAGSEQGKGTYTLGDLAGGYYLVKDADIKEGDDKAYTAYIVQVISDTPIKPKSVKPTVDKQVFDNDDPQSGENGDNNGWGETADHMINESFQFKLIATLPAEESYAFYEKYKLVFTDTMSNSVTFEKIDSVKVIVGDTSTDVTAYTHTAQKDQKGGSWTLTIANLKTAVENLDLTKGAIVEVLYSAHLNEDAGIGDVDVNNNKVGLQYSNNPNVTGEGAGDELGKTPEDTVWVFTYEAENTKVNGDEKIGDKFKPLAGAKFVLCKDAKGEQVIPLKKVSDGLYVPAAAGETGEEMVSAEETGKFNIKGLDAGTYYLVEKTAPAGFNTCDPVEVVISATHNEDGDGQSASTTIKMQQDGNTADAITVINNKGTVLPSTGGMGTTLFYIIGAIMVIGAGVLLITRRRVNVEK